MPAESIDIALQLGSVHVFAVTVDERGNEGLRQDYELLDAHEQQLAARFVFAKDRNLYIMAHAMLRRSLSRFVNVSPSDWCFEFGPQGRPELSSTAHPTLSQLRFNLSHSHGIAVCAIAATFDVGIDVEDTTRSAPLDVADHFFSPSEVATLRSFSADCQPERFFQYWTLKESYIKARGMGLSLPLDQFAFELGLNAPIRISFGAKIIDDPRDWFFQTWMIRHQYRVSLAVRNCGTLINPRLTHSSFWKMFP